MRIIEDNIENIYVEEGLSIALGTFDGVHRGHQQIIKSAVKEAKKRNIKSAVFTFNKHPLEVLKPDTKLSILTDNLTKAKVIEELGVDYLILVNFNKDFASIEPVDFLGLLKEKLNSRVLVCGYNYTFGKFGKGNRQLLEKLKLTLGFDLKIIEKISFGEEDISSSIIREKIQSGNIEEANLLLGYRYFYTGEVLKGKQLGRELGFPTVNLSIPEQLSIKNGIYITLTHVNNMSYPSITNVGYCPTFELNKRSIEAHILNYTGYLYGSTVKVEFLKFVREEIKFNSLDDLKKQVFEDIKAAKAYFSSINVYNR